MTEEELQNSMYNVECDLEKVDDDISYLIEVLKCRTDELLDIYMKEIKEALKEAKED